MAYSTTILTEALPLHVEQHGEGTPLLLLHGFPLDHTIWNAQVESLHTACRVITPDLRGHGRSPAPDGAYTMDVLARDVLLALDQLGIEKAVWVGHSMGGYVTLAAWRLAPERFAGLGLVASNYLADTDEARAKRLETAEKVSREGSEAALNTRLFREGTPVDTPAVQEVYRIMRATAPAGIIGSLQAMAARPDSTETLKTITVPALVIGGAGDQLFKPEIPQQMAALIPGATLVMADQSGHMPMLEQPALVTHALSELVARVNSG